MRKEYFLPTIAILNRSRERGDWSTHCGRERLHFITHVFNKDPITGVYCHYDVFIVVIRIESMSHFNVVLGKQRYTPVTRYDVPVFTDSIRDLKDELESMPLYLFIHSYNL